MKVSCQLREYEVGRKDYKGEALAVAEADLRHHLLSHRISHLGCHSGQGNEVRNLAKNASSAGAGLTAGKKSRSLPMSCENPKRGMSRDRVPTA